MTIILNSTIRSRIIFVSTVLIAATFFASCEKDLDYSRPAGANTVKSDIDSAFNDLTQASDITWAWKFPNSVYGNRFPEILLQFAKDSTADVYSISTRGILTDMAALRASGTLTASESSDVLSFIDLFNGETDSDIRLILENPANLYFKNYLQAYLPNYLNFNGLTFKTEEQNVSFNVNSVVQTSLTFGNSNYFPQLKQNGIVDFDFRIMKFSRDSILLNSYKNDLENVNTTLYPFKIATVPPFVSASALIVSANPLKARVFARLNGTTLATPSGYNSMLEFFYRSYNQAFSSKYAAYGFIYNGLGSTVQPAVLKDAAFIVPTATFNGNVSTAPAGTVLITFAVKFANGTSQNMEFVKN